MKNDVLKAKEAVVSEISSLVSENAAVVVCEYRGLTVKKISALRSKLKSLDAKANIYKNTLFTRAIENSDQKSFEDYLTGPNVFVFFKDFTNGSLKALSKFARMNPELSIKAGIIDGKVQDKEYVVTLANLPSKEGLVSMLLSVLQAPMRNLAYSLSQVAEKK